MPRDTTNLNDIQRREKSFDWAASNRDATAGSVTAHFGDVASALETFITGSEALVGCVAWLTSPRMIAALSGRPVALVVTKEWWLRSTNRTALSVRRRELYATLTGGLAAEDFPAPLSGLGGRIDPVRAMGHNPRARSAAHPLMHSKFLVRLVSGRPVAVWTGSFNLSKSAESNIENAVEIHDPAIAAAYLAEFARVEALSEPLDFAAGRIAPTWVGKPLPATAARKAPRKQRPRKKKRAAKKPVATGRTRRLTAK